MSNVTTLVIDIGSSNIDAVIAKKGSEGNSIEIIGSGSSKSEGIEKGLISDIHQLGSSIKKAVVDANKTSDEDIKSATVSISNTYCKTQISTASISTPTGYIDELEIKKVLETAYHNANIATDYEMIHILPIYFKVDGIQTNSPLSLTGAKLEASVTIIIVKKATLVNIENALKPSHLSVENFVLSGYASSLAILNEDEKKYGTFLVDMGSSSISMILYNGKSILFSDFISIGSEHITNDISITFNTTHLAAETIKTDFATLKAILPEDSLFNKKIRAPIIGNEDEKNEHALIDIQRIIHARVEEMLIMTFNVFKENGLGDKSAAGIVFTGGLSRLPGIKELASQVFDKYSVKIANIKNIENEYIDLSSNNKSALVGLMLYALKTDVTFELDSQKRLIYNKLDIMYAVNNATELTLSNPIKDTELPIVEEDTKNNISFLKKFTSKFMEWF
jgi:cell division protein FtsA